MIFRSNEFTVYDQADPTKRLRLDVSKIPSGTTRTTKITADDSDAVGRLASADRTGETGSIGPIVLKNTSHANLYRLSIYLVISAAGTAGTVSVTVAWNDGVQGQSTTVISLFPLTVLGDHSSTTKVLYSPANQDISYSTVVAGIVGNPTYDVRLRLESL